MKLASLSRALPMASLALSPGIAWAERHHPVPMATPRFQISFASAAHAAPITGRFVSSSPGLRSGATPSSPRAARQCSPSTSISSPGRRRTTNRRSAFPRPLADLPPGDYFVQAVINVYEQVHRSDGKTVWVHLNDGTAEFFTIAAGNLYSDVAHARRRQGADGNRSRSKSRTSCAATAQDTEWLKHVKIQSPMLAKFWGRPIFVHAHVLLPKGYAEHPTTHYPRVYTLGQASAALVQHHAPENGIAERDQSGDRKSKRLRNVPSVERRCIPRVVAITLEQQTPYFPDSYR